MANGMRRVRVLSMVPSYNVFTLSGFWLFGPIVIGDKLPWFPYTHRSLLLMMAQNKVGDAWKVPFRLAWTFVFLCHETLGACHTVDVFVPALRGPCSSSQPRSP